MIASNNIIKPKTIIHMSKSTNGTYYHNGKISLEYDFDELRQNHQFKDNTAKPIKQNKFIFIIISYLNKLFHFKY